MNSPPSNSNSKPVGYFRGNSSPGSFISAAPPPPVPPRSKRSSLERSPSAAQVLGNMVSRIPSQSTSNSISRRTKRNLSKDLEGNLDGRSGGRNPTRPKSVTDMRSSKSEANMVDAVSPMEHDEKENINSHKSEIVENGQSVGRRKSESSIVESEVEQKISVKERMQKFNRIASESELHHPSVSLRGHSRSRKEASSKVFYSTNAFFFTKEMICMEF